MKIEYWVRERESVSFAFPLSPFPVLYLSFRLLLLLIPYFLPIISSVSFFRTSTIFSMALIFRYS